MKFLKDHFWSPYNPICWVIGGLCFLIFYRFVAFTKCNENGEKKDEKK